MFWRKFEVLIRNMIAIASGALLGSGEGMGDRDRFSVDTNFASNVQHTVRVSTVSTIKLDIKKKGGTVLETKPEDMNEHFNVSFHGSWSIVQLTCCFCRRIPLVS